jgi:hypothetical protein
MNPFCHSERSEAESKLQRSRRRRRGQAFNLSIFSCTRSRENRCAFVRSLTTFGMTTTRHHVRAG